MKYAFGPYAVDTERLEFFEGGEAIQLQPQVFALLVHLIENRERVVTKDEVIAAVWDGRIVSDGTLNARINSLRAAVGDDGKRQEVIRTLPRRGFRFVAELADEPEAPSSPSSAASDPQSIAVLPFENLSHDPEQDYFATGLTEDLITDLSKTADLHVVARQSAFAVQQTTSDVIEIGRALSVRYVLQGSARKVGRQVRINVQLVDAETGANVWADRYDRTLDDIFALQDEIVAQIIKELQVSLGAAGRQAAEGLNVDAYELFLKARARFYEFSAEAFEDIYDLTARALEIDPSFGEAWAAQVFAYQSGCSFFFEGYDDGYRRALEVGRKGVEISPDSAFCQGRYAWILLLNYRFPDALKHFERSTELDPRNAELLAYYGEAMNFYGDPVQGEALVDRALTFEPVIPPNCAYHKGHALYLQGRVDEALPLIQRCIDIAPVFPPAQITMAAALAETGDIEAARHRVAAVKAIAPRITRQLFNDRYPYRLAEHRERIMSALDAAGLA